MRASLIFFTATIVVAGTTVSYFVFRDGPQDKKAGVTMNSLNSIPSLNVNHGQIGDKHEDTLNQFEDREVTRLSRKISELEARLQSMEIAERELGKVDAYSEIDQPDSKNAMKKSKEKKFSEAYFSYWMDEALNAGYYDEATTKKVEDQVETTLAKLKGMNLTDMQCGERFCRANLVSEPGKSISISQLVGASPLMGSAYTIVDRDGGVKIYFTQASQSMTELRSEAQSAFLAGHPQR